MADFYSTRRPGLGDDLGRLSRGVGSMFEPVKGWAAPRSNRLLMAGLGMLSGRTSQEGFGGAMKGLVAGSALDKDAARSLALESLMNEEGGVLANASPGERRFLSKDPDAAASAIVAGLKHDPLDAYTYTDVDGVLYRNNKYTGESSPVGGGTGGVGNKQLERERDLRRDAVADKQYERFQQAVPVYQSMVETGGRDTKFSDLNLVYGLAKIMDPNSVVMSGETIAVRDASGIPEGIMGFINTLNGGGQLTPASRSALLKEARSRMNEYRKAAAQQQGFYGAVADRAGIDRGLVLPGLQDLDEFTPADELIATPE